MNRLLIVAILVISTVPLFAQGQQPDVAKLKTDAQNVASIISGDNAKTQTWCQLLRVWEQGNQVKDTKEAEALNQKVDELQDQLGPEYVALVLATVDMDPNSEDSEEIWSPIKSLACTQ